ncbi:hypothetical protein [Micromonospora sp. 067-2]
MTDLRRPMRQHHQSRCATLDLLRCAPDGDRTACGRLYGEHVDLSTGR